MRLVVGVAVAARVVCASDGLSGYGYTGYGVDVSFPMHHFQKPGSEGAKAYEDFIQGCGEKFRLTSCQSNEAARMDMNRRQIALQRNFTELGFAKLLAPRSVYEPAREFWDRYKNNRAVESWPAGNTYVNNWLSPTEMVSLEDRNVQPMGMRVKRQIWAGAQPILEAWTGQTLKATSLYGIRVYSQDAILATHVDRMPLVTSAIIQVAQDLDDPWPVEVVGHDGRAYNVTLMPGEMALYESHTVLHGRPHKLKGRFFANVFVHFIPTDPARPGENHPDLDFSWQKTSKAEERDKKVARAGRARRALWPQPPPAADSLAAAVAAADAQNELYEALGNAPARAHAEEPAHELEGMAHAPARDSRAERLAQARKAVESPFARRAPVEEGAEEGHQVHRGEDFGADAFTTGSKSLHDAAANGDLQLVLDTLRRDPSAANGADENLWTPLHEAARSDAHDAFKIAQALVKSGADLGARTLGGGTALWLARQYHNADVVRYLESIGAPEIGDEHEL